MTRHKVLPALAMSLVVNACLIGVAALLSHERSVKPDMSNPVGVNLVTLDAPEPPQQEERKPPEKPKPKPQPDFKPDLMRPQLASLGNFEGGVAIDLGGMGGSGLNSEFIFESYELDQPPQPVVKTNPVYPYLAREKGIEGVVQVKILVNSDGSVGQVQVMAARPEGVFDEAVIDAVPKWRFKPGTIEGKQVTSWVVTALKFRLN